MQEIVVSRRVAFGPNAIRRISSVCDDIGISKIMVFSGSTKTQKITHNLILPELENHIEYDYISLSDSITLEDLKNYATNLADVNTQLMAVGGGKIIDYVKVIASIAKRDYIAVPTNASHDGFSSPYINFLLREKIKMERKKSNFPRYIPISPLAIIGDTKLVSQASESSISAGVGDVLSKSVAIRDWRLANRLKGEKFDIYAATFAEMTATLVSDRVCTLGHGFISEKGARDLLKALASSGVAMCIAGSSRPASGSEHLVSHALDKIAEKEGLNIAHGHKTGLISILMMYLHGGDWQKIHHVLKRVNAPLTLKDLKLDRDIFLDAVKIAQKIRPNRYTILSEGITKSALINALEITGID